MPSRWSGRSVPASTSSSRSRWESRGTISIGWSPRGPDGDGTPLLMVGFNRRFSPALQKLQQLVAGRRAPLVIQYRLNAGYLPLDHWVHGAQGGGRNVGEACHMYDVFRFLAGSPVRSIDATAIDPGALPYARNDNFAATIALRGRHAGESRLHRARPEERPWQGAHHRLLRRRGLHRRRFQEADESERRLGAVAELRARQGTFRGTEPVRRRDRLGRIRRRFRSTKSSRPPPCRSTSKTFFTGEWGDGLSVRLAPA